MKKYFVHPKFTATFTNEGTGENNRYFSFTGKIDGSSGAVGDDIAVVYPPFKILNDLHLANLLGEPMHALENGWYHFQQAKQEDKIQALENYWHVELNEEQVAKLIAWIVNDNTTIENALHHASGKSIISGIMEEIRPIWKAKVEAALELVEKPIDESIDFSDMLKKQERNKRAEKFKHYPKTEMFRIIDTIGVPHPYCLTPRHLEKANGDTFAVLDAYSMKDAEKRGARCGVRGCNLSYDEHKQALLVEAKHDGELTDIKTEVQEYLLSIKELAEKENYVGFAFIKALI